MGTLLPHLALPAEGHLDVAELFERSPLAGEGREGGAGSALSGESIAVTPTPRPAPQGGGASLGLAPLVLEIGFGGGEHLVAQATAHPGQRFIGVEPFLNGVASCLRHIEDANAQNIRLHQGDARDVVARLPGASLDLVYILFPDPWPKTRHHKRRLIQREFLGELARVMKPNAELRFATDWAHYAAWTLEHFTRDARFVWTAERAEDWRKPWPAHVPTRYEQKKLGACPPVWLRFERST